MDTEELFVWGDFGNGVCVVMIYTKEELFELRKKLSNLTFINTEKREEKPTHTQIEKMVNLCKKRNNPSYYKLRHASGMSEEYGFKGINFYSDDGKKMRRFESGLGVSKLKKVISLDSHQSSIENSG